MSESAVAKVTDADVAFSEGGVQIADMAQAWRFAGWIKQSKMAPAELDQAGIVVVLQKGAELGLKPMAALAGICVVKGKPTLYGKTLAAVIRASGAAKDLDFGAEERDGVLTGWARSTREGWEGRRETTFSWTEAETAGLTRSNPTYKSYPGRMLAWRALSWHADQYYSDLTGGMGVAEDSQTHEYHGPRAERVISPVAEDPLLTAGAEAPAAEEAPVEAEEVIEVEAVTEEPVAPEPTVVAYPNECRRCGTKDDVVEGFCPAHAPDDGQGTLI